MMQEALDDNLELAAELCKLLGLRVKYAGVTECCIQDSQCHMNIRPFIVTSCVSTTILLIFDPIHTTQLQIKLYKTKSSHPYTRVSQKVSSPLSPHHTLFLFCEWRQKKHTDMFGHYSPIFPNSPQTCSGTYHNIQ
jgi:hypothetical protein